MLWSDKQTADDVDPGTKTERNLDHHVTFHDACMVSHDVF